MRYQLPVGVPVTWSSSAEVRVGGSHLGRVFPDHPAVHAMLDALKLGTDEKFLRILAKSHGLGRERVDAVVEGLIAISVPVTVPTTGSRRVIVRTPPSAESFARIVVREFARRHHGTALVGADSRDGLDAADLVVEVAEFVIPTRRYLPLLAADVPHLALIRDIDGLQVGPLVVPGQTPCLRCDDLCRLAEHPEWPAVATQLVDSPPVTLPAEIDWLGALHAGLIGGAYLGPGEDAPPLGTRRTLIHPKTGEVSVLPRSFHAGCGCQVPPSTETVAPPTADTKGTGISVLA
ncbi:hypothetical protein [Gulosibacter molinativorax]|uniref:hypothetical protein n=1 Tax=Gulosibacter molinativorax TaxID=256821 RepID=UPI00047EE5AF|nr:hypothetical protein [Gulosibacter molinativorax]QUY61998.1 Hypotetical protein [Gulosibacter molinativorax]